jgi:hypothetical protein
MIIWAFVGLKSSSYNLIPLLISYPSRHHPINHYSPHRRLNYLTLKDLKTINHRHLNHHPSRHLYYRHWPEGLLNCTFHW